jgi:hypothetical protein
MSIFHPVTVTCSACKAQSQFERCASVNADRRPDLRAAILAGAFQAESCASCGTALRLPPHFTYIEIGRKTWIAAEPASILESWPDVEDEISDVYSRSFGEDAPASGQDLAEGLQARLVFGWPAFREKLICADLGLDDVTLELLKMAIMRDVEKPPMADETELRLVGGDAENLEFVWFVTLSEQRLVSLTVPREIYDDIAAEPEPWAVARGNFEDVFLVDLRRLIAGPELDEGDGLVA